ncbi:50S ribosomal protein L3 [Nitratiruptor sp. YY09-18]|uniref:50S ribosomal protein L3 n=1 Tax=Nitratiruptor sp. YY09-18 TaxID=2724901 RepID=UPI0019163D12|nr:50S ribosomal protein L3 [Nitratiruptor sp. YY09-18]BCD67360.1 large subunit ribosomal protein L3 [Nitratiruptor sp. YY09-18]
MEFIVEKIGMSRTIGIPSVPVTLLKVKEAKVCEIVGDNKAIVAYGSGKKRNKAIEGQQKKYGLTPEFNRFVTLKVANSEPGNLDLSPLGEAKRVKISFNSKGRGFSGVVKRWNFAGGPDSHGSRFHRAPGSVGMCEWPGRIMPGQKMPGQYGNKKVTVQNEVVSFDPENGILVVKGSVPGPNGALGKVRIVK